MHEYDPQKGWGTMDLGEARECNLSRRATPSLSNLVMRGHGAGGGGYVAGWLGVWHGLTTPGVELASTGGGGESG